MTNKNLPDTGADKNTPVTNPTDKRTNTTPDNTIMDKKPMKDEDRRGAEGTIMDLGNTANVPNPGRDNTTGGTGGDGTNRKMPNDSTTEPTDTDGDEDAVEVDDDQEQEVKA